MALCSACACVLGRRGCQEPVHFIFWGVRGCKFFGERLEVSSGFGLSQGMAVSSCVWMDREGRGGGSSGRPVSPRTCAYHARRRIQSPAGGSPRYKGMRAEGTGMPLASLTPPQLPVLDGAGSATTLPFERRARPRKANPECGAGPAPAPELHPPPTPTSAAAHAGSGKSRKTHC